MRTRQQTLPVFTLALLSAACETGAPAAQDDADQPIDSGADAGSCSGCGTAHCVAGSCVDCTAATEHIDCPLSAPSCAAGVCARCTADAGCSNRSATPVCDESSGACVACTADEERARCGLNSCSSISHTCTSTARGSLDVCDACESDSECMFGYRCVMHSFQGAAAGHFCLLSEAQQSCRAPYSNVEILTSIDGVRATYCLPPPLTTCEGIRALGTPCTVDDECGDPDLDDGVCPSSGPGAGSCSYLCADNLDCAPRRGTACDGTPRRCLQ